MAQRTETARHCNHRRQAGRGSIVSSCSREMARPCKAKVCRPAPCTGSLGRALAGVASGCQPHGSLNSCHWFRGVVISNLNLISNQMRVSSSCSICPALCTYLKARQNGENVNPFGAWPSWLATGAGHGPDGLAPHQYR